MQDICPSTHKNAHIYVRCVHEACLILGGEHHLARYLNVDVKMIEAWLNGDAQPPDDIFLRCSDLMHRAGKPRPQNS